MNLLAVRNELHRMFPLRWKMTRGYRLPTGDPAQPYYISWSAAPRPIGEGWDAPVFDEHGVVQIGTYRNPVQLSQFGFHQYARACEGDERARASFLAQATYLAHNQRSDGGYEYPIPAPAFNAKPGWLSAMAQGEAASVLLRAHAITGDAMYLERGRHALEPLKRDMSRGGASTIDRGDVFFEEVAAEPACHILNGHLYAHFGVWEYVRFGFADDELTTLYHDALRTVERWLPYYDAGGWSCYDLAADSAGRRHYAPLWYHHFHIAQLRVFAAMTQRDIFAGMADRWESALHRYDVRARVWAYNAASLARAAARRVQRRATTAFQPIVLPAAPTEPAARS